MAWKMQNSEFFEARFKRFFKKHPNEAAAVLNNLDTYLKTLQKGTNPVNIAGSFIHPESD